MGDKTNISWCDSTHNFWRGCTKVSPGCTNCYAETLVTTRLQGEWGKGKPRVRAKDFNAPLRWNKKPWVCDGCGKAFDHPDIYCCGIGSHRRRVFSLSLGDWLDDEVPIQWLADMLDIVRRCPDLDFLLLTKRPENWMLRMVDVMGLHCRIGANSTAQSDNRVWAASWMSGEAPPNVWIGTSVEDQQRADERIPELLKIPASVRFLSVEPMLGPIDLRYPTFNGADSLNSLEGIDWVIFGGESGPGARPCNIEWIRDGLKQCQAAGIKAFIKQLGSNIVIPHPQFQGESEWHLKLKDKKGGNITEFPEDLRVREWPKNKQ